MVKKLYSKKEQDESVDIGDVFCFSSFWNLILHSTTTLKKPMIFSLVHCQEYCRT